MLTVFPFYQGDTDRMIHLLEWILDLGGCKNHDALLVADAGTDWQRCMEIKKLCEKSFRDVRLITNAESVHGWIDGPKSLFLAGAKYAQRNNVSFLQMETDAIPLVSGWLDKIEQAWTERTRAMGHVYKCNQPGLPLVMLSGIAVYSPDILSPEVEKKILEGAHWDVVLSRILAPDDSDHTTLIHHMWGEHDNPPTFVRHKTDYSSKQPFLLSDIPKSAAIWHRNKDGTLINLLREKMGLKAKEPVSILKKPENRKIISVRRTAALGDVLASTVVAQKLMDMGYDVSFQAHPSTHCILRRVVPPLRAIMEPVGNAQVNLDNAYEGDPKRRERHFADMFVARANLHLAAQNIRIENWKNFAPRMEVTLAEKSQALSIFKQYPRPWTLICPRSNAWVNRTVPDHIWGAAAAKIAGTKFWMGNHGTAPGGIVDLHCRHFDTAIGYLSAADLLISVDTGPAHVALALGTPAVIIEQASSPDVHFSDQRDWIKIAPKLNCLNCQADRCPIHASTPPCQNIPPEMIADAANARLRHVTTEDVSVVVVIHKPTAARLNRCLSHVIGQVQEIVVVVDSEGVIPQLAMTDPKIKYIKLRQWDVGYGRKANFGARHTNGKYIWFLNDDCYVQSDTCQKLLEVIRTDDAIGMVGHELRYADGTLQHGGTFRARDGVGFGHMDLRQRESRVKHPMEVENVTGASIMCRRRAYWDADGHFEEYFLYCEDNHLCMTMRQAGWKIYYTPHAKATHEESQSTSLKQGLRDHMKRSQQIFYNHWHGYFERNKNNTGLGVFE
jgi:GT2 family glycosyltransferase